MQTTLILEKNLLDKIWIKSYKIDNHKDEHIFKNPTDQYIYNIIQAQNSFHG